VTARAQVALPIKSVYEQEGTLINYYGRLQHVWPTAQEQKGDTAAGWVWAERLLTGLGSAASLSSASAVFAKLAEKAQALRGLSLSDVDEEGVVLESLLPSEWPERAPRPADGARSIRGPQTTPPGMKVGDEASGGSR
jgi:NADH dehydrogenase/NADH:ubiquinone oxidoreductase subunit G